MPRPKPKCETLLPWLRSNLGRGVLAPLTGTDYRSLAAAVMIIEAWYYNRKPSLLMAFGLVVAQMQRSTQELAYHAIAHAGNWEERAPIWQAAGLDPFDALAVCSFEPGGPCIDLAKANARPRE